MEGVKRKLCRAPNRLALGFLFFGEFWADLEPQLWSPVPAGPFLQGLSWLPVPFGWDLKVAHRFSGSLEAEAGESNIVVPIPFVQWFSFWLKDCFPPEPSLKTFWTLRLKACVGEIITYLSRASNRIHEVGWPCLHFLFLREHYLPSLFIIYLFSKS